MRWLRRALNTAHIFLFTSEMPLWKYCLIAFPVALVPSIVLLGSVALVLGALVVQVEILLPPETEVSVGAAFSAIVVAPLLETPLLALLLALLGKFSNRAGFVASASGVLWGIAHGVFGALWFFGTAWSFFVMSCAFLHWRKQSFAQAFIAAAVPHALINFTMMLWGVLL